MRVDFLGNFKQVQRLINSRAPQAQNSPEFANILEPQNSKNVAQIAEIITENPIKQNAIDNPVNSYSARYNFSKPELLAPIPAPIEVPAAVSEPVNESPISVKTPSGLSGRLVKVEDPFAGLSKLEAKQAVGRLVSLAGAEHGIDPALSLGVIRTESNFNPVAISSDGHASKGLMQLLDSTGQEMMGRLGEEGNYTPFDPAQNIDLGVGYLRRLHDVFSSPTDLGANLKTFAAANSSSLEKLAVAAYNAGEGRVASAQQRANRAGKDPAVYENIENYLPEITREYVKRVMTARSETSGVNKG